MLLAIDTATRITSIALHNGDDVLAEQTWASGSAHHAILPRAIDDMLRGCDTSAAELDALAVCNGPGSYTGMRIGVALAKGIATVNDLPLVGVSTLDILAAGTPITGTRHKLIVVVQAGRGRIIAATYRVKKGEWVEQIPAEITTWDDLLPTLTSGTFQITGEVNAAGRDAVAEFSADDVQLNLLDGALRLRRAGFLASVALSRLNDASNGAFDSAQLVPIYMKSPG